MSACKCDFRTRMLGDGCEMCNPAKSLEYAKETIAEQAALIKEMGEALERIAGLDYANAAINCCALTAVEISQAALAKWKESK